MADQQAVRRSIIFHTDKGCPRGMLTKWVSEDPDAGATRHEARAEVDVMVREGLLSKPRRENWVTVTDAGWELWKTLRDAHHRR